MIVVSLVALAGVGIGAIWGESLLEVANDLFGEQDPMETTPVPPPKTNKDLL